MLRPLPAGWTLVAAGVLLVGCAPEADAPGVRRFDENGVEVVLSERPAWGEGGGWRLSAEPEVVIGEDTTDPRYLFPTIFGGRLGAGLGPVRLVDGQIVAGDVLTAEVRFFDAAGEFPGVERLGHPRGSAPHPLGKTTARALGTERAYIGMADDFEIEVWSFDGSLRQRWRRSAGDLTVRAGDVDAYLAVESPDTHIAGELAADVHAVAAARHLSGLHPLRPRCHRASLGRALPYAAAATPPVVGVRSRRRVAR